MGDDRQLHIAPVLPTYLLSALLAGLVVTAAFYVIILASDDPAAMHLANGSLPALLGGVCLWCGYATVKRRPSMLWTPMPWLLAAWSAYYGLGPLAYIYGTPETVAYMDSFYPVDQRALLRTNLLNVVGLATLISAFALSCRIRADIVFPRRCAHEHAPERVGLLFLAIGAPVKYLLELPYELGLVDYVLPGSIQYFGSFSGLAILPLRVAAAERRRGARPLLWTLIAAEVIVGFIKLSKLDIIIIAVLVFLGQYAVRPNPWRMIPAGLFIMTSYIAVLSPFVSYARTLLGRTSAQDLSELVVATNFYAAKGRETMADLLPGVQGWWSRLAYPNAQAFAMDQYDRGKPGWTVDMVGYALLPRFLYADKPIMTPGREFTYLVRGTDTSSTGLGFVAEAYWNGGWLLVVLTALLVGTLFGILGRLSLSAVLSRKWLFAPLIFQSVYLGLRLDDWFVPTYIGGVLNAVVVTVLLRFAFASLVSQQGGQTNTGRAANSRPQPLPRGERMR